ncbi:MAG: hypothetical protein MPL62_15595, partial [Alphaproteobacteria bacterium]|nr:hypothetical protein [Alphaproteobacteria bacterium]
MALVAAVLMAPYCAYGLEMEPPGSIERGDLPLEIRVSSPSNLPPGTPVTMDVAGPGGFSESQTVDAGIDGSFEFFIRAGQDWPAGWYEVTVQEERTHIERFRIWSLETPAANSDAPDPARGDGMRAAQDDPGRDLAPEPAAGDAPGGAPGGPAGGAAADAGPVPGIPAVDDGTITMLVVFGIPAVIVLVVISKVLQKRKNDICHECGGRAAHGDPDVIQFKITSQIQPGGPRTPVVPNVNMIILLHHGCLARGIWKVEGYVDETPNHRYPEIGAVIVTRRLNYSLSRNNDGSWTMAGVYLKH